MWIQAIAELNELREFLVSQLDYDEKRGFSFVGITPGVEPKQITDALGPPEVGDTQDEQQQTFRYSALVDHPTEGKRDHHNLSALFWCFEGGPLEVIRIHFDYYKTGDFAAAFQQFIRDLMGAVIEKFGAPEKKSLKAGREEIDYARGKHKFFMWSNAEGLRIQIK